NIVYGNDGVYGQIRDLEEPAAAEAAQQVPVPVELARALHALGEDQRQLALVVEQPVGVVGVGGDAAAPRPQRPGHRHGAEEEVGQAVHRPAQLLLDAVHDGGAVGRGG